MHAQSAPVGIPGNMQAKVFVNYLTAMLTISLLNTSENVIKKSNDNKTLCSIQLMYRNEVAYYKNCWS